LSFGANPDSLFRLNQYQQAAIEYERVIFRSENPKEINNALYKKAQCYKLLGNYNNALSELNQITYWNLNDSIAEIYRYETALCNYLNANFKESELQLNQIDVLGCKYINTNQFALLKVLVYNETKQWSKALENATIYVHLSYSPLQADSLEQILKKAYVPKRLPKYKSEKKANVLRMMPGLGQVYMGKTAEGSFNFLLNLSFLSFGAYQIYSGYYVTGYFVGAIGLSKVYFGGHARTDILLRKHNYTVHRNFCNNIKSIITKKAG
jgi:tetratricopeptide (TPR) repeat protein